MAASLERLVLIVPVMLMVGFRIRVLSLAGSRVRLIVSQKHMACSENNMLWRFLHCGGRNVVISKLQGGRKEEESGRFELELGILMTLISTSFAL